MHWDSAPYHLRLVLMHSAGRHSTAKDDLERAELIEAVERLLDRRERDVSPVILETLQVLGALSDDARKHRSVVFKNVRNCLTRPTDSESQVEAWGFYLAQFDHPYSEAYCEVFSDLADRDLKTLLKMAAKGVSGPSLFVAPLLLDLASFGDEDVAESIARWTHPPPADNRVMPQSDIHAFVIAHLAMAKLGCPLPANRTVDDEPPVVALNACGAILYWSNRTDLDDDATLTACKSELLVLGQEGKFAAVDVIRECEHVCGEGLELLPGDKPVVYSVVAQFPVEVAAICRKALLEPASQVGYFRHWGCFDRQRILAFAIGVLKDHGDVRDRSLLRRYASIRVYGERAIAALKAIENRLARATE